MRCESTGLASAAGALVAVSCRPGWVGAPDRAGTSSGEGAGGLGAAINGHYKFASKNLEGRPLSRALLPIY